jgi:hypothetical protein
MVLAAVTSLTGLPYLLPYVRVLRLVDTILGTPWDAATWAVVRTQVPRVMELQRQVEREGVVELNDAIVSHLGPIAA